MVSSRPGRQPVNCNSAVLCAVYIPTTFISGLQGSFYQQFSITIATANVISVFVSLTLSPALAALCCQLFRSGWLLSGAAILRRGDWAFKWLSSGHGWLEWTKSPAGELTATRRHFGLAVALVRCRSQGSSAAQRSAAEPVSRQL